MPVKSYPLQKKLLMSNKNVADGGRYCEQIGK